MSNSILKSANEVMNTIFGGLPYTADDRYYEILNNISIAVVDYRVKHGFSQKQLAEKLDVSQAMVSKYESGDYNISLKALVSLLDKLNIRMSIDFDGVSAVSEPELKESSYVRYDAEADANLVGEALGGIA